MAPHVNITIAVRDQSHDQKAGSGGPPGSLRDEVMEWALPSSASWTSPAHVTIAILLVFVLSPVIICSNALILIAVYRFKRLRYPSNYFVISLASADFGVGLLLPPGLYFEFSRSQVRCVLLCLFPYCLFILLGSVSLLSMAAVAVDRCTSLASPLRYNNIITHRSVIRYIAMFWMYSLILSSSPVLFWLATSPEHKSPCSFSLVVLPAVRIFLFSFLFAPCAVLIITCYGYVYIVARSHARAIFSAELSFRQDPCSGPRYGRTLAATVGLFLLVWMPFQVAMFTSPFGEKTTFYLGILVLAGAAVDPWLYGYRSAEFRLASFRILEGISPHLSGALYKPQVRRQSIPFTSCASHARLGVTPNHMTHSMDTMCATFIEIPVATVPLNGIAAAQV